ncbi:hypothetical protein JCM3774_001470 [Rhodotorula dairenensis]
MRDTDSKRWRLGEHDKFASLQDEYNVFHPVNRSEVPPDAKILGARFVHRRKKDQNGQVIGHKVRLVAEGFTQRPNVNFRETAAPVVKFTSICVLLALAARHHLHVYQADVDKAYLHGALEEDLYMRVLEGIDGSEYASKVLKLNRTLYGLKQAGRVWNHRIHPTPLPVDSHLRGADNYDVWVIQIRALVGHDACRLFDGLSRAATPEAFDTFAKEYRAALAAIKAANVQLETIYSSHLLNALPPSLSAFQTSLAISNSSELPKTDKILELLRNEILRLSSSSSSASVALGATSKSVPPSPCPACNGAHWMAECPTPKGDQYRARRKERLTKRDAKGSAKARLAQTSTPAAEPVAQLATLLGEEEDVEVWLTISAAPTASEKPTIDSGATHCMCGDVSLFFNFRQCAPSPVGGVSGNKNGLVVTGVGSLLLKLASGRSVVIHQALLVPGIAVNLLSTSQLYDNHGVTTTFGKEATLSRDGVVLATGSRLRKHLYQLDGELIAPASAKDQCAIGRRYVVTFVDDYSRMLWVEPLAHKSDVFGAFQRFKAAAENESGRRIQRFRLDNGGEYTSHEFRDYFAKQGIRHETPPPYSPQSNGVAQRINRTIVEGLISLLDQSHAPKNLWAEALLAFVFVKNRSPHAALSGGVPLAVWRSKPVRVDMLRVWGCRAYHTVTNGRAKLDNKAIPLIFVGYEGDSAAYRLFDPVTRKMPQAPHRRRT